MSNHSNNNESFQKRRKNEHDETKQKHWKRRTRQLNRKGKREYRRGKRGKVNENILDKQLEHYWGQNKQGDNYKNF